MVTRKKTNNDPQHTIQKTEDRRNTNPTKKECEVVTNVLQNVIILMCFKTNVTYKNVQIHLHAPGGHFDDR